MPVRTERPRISQGVVGDWVDRAVESEWECELVCEVLLLEVEADWEDWVDCKEMGEVHEEGGVSFSEITTLCFRNILHLFPNKMSECGKEINENEQWARSIAKTVTGICALKEDAQRRSKVANGRD